MLSLWLWGVLLVVNGYWIRNMLRGVVLEDGIWLQCIDVLCWPHVDWIECELSEIAGQACNMLYVFGGNQVYLVFSARVFVKWNCCVSVWVDVVKTRRCWVGLREKVQERLIQEGWYLILKNIQTKQAGNIRCHESREGSRQV
jgi:hypothetical protein